jgi:hypothetical protein
MLDIKNFGPCFVAVSHSKPTYTEDYNYGPFTTGAEAIAWMDAQFLDGFRGDFHVVQLRTPSRTRTHDDWWLSDEHQKPEFFNLEYPEYSGKDY